MGFVSYVVLPLQQLQIQIAQLQVGILDNKKITEEAMQEHASLRSRMDVLETEVHLQR